MKKSITMAPRMFADSIKLSSVVQEGLKAHFLHNALTRYSLLTILKTCLHFYKTMSSIASSGMLVAQTICPEVCNTSGLDLTTMLEKCLID